ncbi:MAG: formate-dependent nitrite reductase, membrane component [bacterium P3]|nr:MAG: formate-dependent nitrite reductase, membrane component [bacterium P3]KWW42115.1 MAG: formate-dependent nitrite reductase, membrane component [bacterium F083]
MKQYHRINNIVGWLVCIAACTVYVLTAEATASWWDCGEYIATAFKLQVGHPPGAPSFQLIGRIFSMFSDPATAAHAVNIMSALCSGFTILFLFWGITLLGKHLLPDPQNPDVKNPRTWAVFAAGVVGALVYTFSDTFWFSAVEGEVYAMSSFFTSLVFWAILKWEEQSSDPRSLRWLLLIALLVGIAIGVHLLNLLTLPAIVYVVYFKKWPETTVKGFIYSGLISLVLLAVILWGVIPGIVNVDSAFDVFFVNKLHLPFNSGTVFFFTILALAIVWGLWITSAKKRNLPVVNASILAFLMLLVGYSTFFMLIIRSNTNTPLNENAPKDAVALRAYLGREQYGDTPLLKGQYYTAGNPVAVEEGYTKYVRGKDSRGRDCYIAAAHAQKYIYRANHTGLFPRMYSNDASRQHPKFYEYWAGKVRGDRKPSSAQNIKYFHGYQMGWMYWRYFMWNFAGRQNDIQGHYFNDNGTRDYLSGNWICGIKAIDEARLGPQDNLPGHLRDNKARNVYYLLPLLLGLAGLVYHIRRHSKDAFIVFIMFVMTGIAIAIYLNMPPRQPRERDYAFVGSFCFFAIWVGLGVMALADWLTALFKNEKLYRFLMPAVFVLCMGVPLLMAAQNWDDHDRSDKYAARDFANNYLRSVNRNGILITFGDNDTFPLWYAQEVEGTRTDVRILNYTLSGMHWYVEQLYNKLYDSDPLPFTLPKEFYGLGKDVVYIMDRSADYLEVTEVLALMRDHPERFTQSYVDGTVTILPTKRFKITVDIPELVRRGVIPADKAGDIDPVIRFEINSGNLMRHQLMILDILGTNRFMRDINIMNPSYIKEVYPLVDRYCIQDGMNYKLLPYMPTVVDHAAQTVTLQQFTDRTFDYFLHGTDGVPLQWGNLNSDIYVDPVSLNMGNVQRQTFTMAALQLLQAGDTARARQMLDSADHFFPKHNFVRDKYCLSSIDTYFRAFGRDRAMQMWDDIYDHYTEEVVYLLQFRGDKAQGVRGRLDEALGILNAMGVDPHYNLGGGETTAKVGQFFNKWGLAMNM